jgi:long-chain-fatty-acid--CoA ligase ACSBG
VTLSASFNDLCDNYFSRYSGLFTGIYTSNSVDSCKHVLKTSEASIVVVDSDAQMEKIQIIRHELPKLKAIVQISTPSHENVLWWNDLEKINTSEVENEYQRRLAEISANECCALVYTSGTVGNPKAVMVSHDNLTWTTKVISEHLTMTKDKREVFMSYLPLSHMAGQILDVYLTLTVAATVYFTEKDAIKSSFLNSLEEIRPTLFIGVPRIYEKIQHKMICLENASGILLKLLDFIAKNLSLKHHQRQKVQSAAFLVAKKLCLNQKKTLLGLDRCRNLLTAAAPMSREMKNYFLSLDLPLREMYGMTEVTVHCMSTKDSSINGTVGRNINGTETKILNPDENGCGEICVKGRNVFMGYLNDVEKTKEAFDDEGFLKTGDCGCIDENGLVYITGRLKEIIITSGGENIPPVFVENLVKAECEAISNAFLVGDGRKFLTILITFKTQIDANGALTNELATETLKWLENIGSKQKSLSGIISDPKVLQVVQAAIDRANRKAISNAQKVQKFAILPRDFSVLGGELGPTMKVKRNVVLEKYKNIIDKLYL